MAYEDYEIPEITTDIYYYEKELSYNIGECSFKEFCEKFWELLVHNDYSDVTNIVIGKDRLVNGISEGYTVKFNKKQISSLDLKSFIYELASDDGISYITFIHKEHREEKWDITWAKDHQVDEGCRVSDYTFNHFSITHTYDFLESYEKQIKYINLFCGLCDLFSAFYGNISDLDSSIELLDRTKETVFNESYLQTIYWGNYLGPKYCKQFGQERLEQIECYEKRKTEKGFYFALSDNMLDELKGCDFRQRKRILKKLTQKNWFHRQK